MNNFGQGFGSSGAPPGAASSAGGFPGFGGQAANRGGTFSQGQGFGAAPSGFGGPSGFGAAAQPAQTAGGFGSAAQPAQAAGGFGTAQSAGGFGAAAQPGGFGAAAQPAQAAGGVSFGKSAGQVPNSQTHLGTSGFGATGSGKQEGTGTALSNPSPSLGGTAGASFGVAGSQPSAAATAAPVNIKQETSTTAATTAGAPAGPGFGSLPQTTQGATGAASTTQPRTGGFGGFATSAAGSAASSITTATATAATAATAAPTATATESASTGIFEPGKGIGGTAKRIRKPASEELKGKVLSSILTTFDKSFSKDFHAFRDLSRRMLLRDLQVIDRGNEILAFMAQLDSAIASAEGTKEMLAVMKTKQSSISAMMQRLEDAVQPVYNKVEPTFTKVDVSRVATYASVINLFDEVEALRLRLQQSVGQHNRSLNQLRERDDMEKVTGLLDYQLTALEVCKHKALQLEKELDYLLGQAHPA